MTRILRPSAPFRAAAIAAAALGALLAGGAPLRAQDPRPAPRDTVPRPPPRDTVPRPRRDTIQVTVPPEALRADTLPDRPRPDSASRDSVAADTLTPAPNFPEFPVAAGTPGFGTAVWEFTREELNRFHSLTLLELLDRIPG
ncbi:MAG TPA: hypothetical protein VK420_13500, partial [Longimicrobium sp.]|nr:hypothetical protein [Longimicrobium sp.]